MKKILIKSLNRDEESDDEHKLRNDRSLGSMSVEQIYNLMTNAMKVNWEENPTKHTYIQSLA